MSERRACRALDVERSVLRYQSRRDPDLALRGRLRELAQTRPAFGHKRLHVLIRRDGWPVNHKKTHRLYKAEGLQLKPRLPRRRRAVTMRQGDPVVLAPNTRWAMDFMYDTLADRSPIRIFTLLDVCTRECVALHVALTLPPKVGQRNIGGFRPGGQPEGVRWRRHSGSTPTRRSSAS